LSELGVFVADLERFALAILFGACIGWEREWRRKPAGLRTHMLVTLGSAAFVIAALRLAGQTSDATVQIDPAKVIEGVAGGIGFLGAGTIIQGRGSVEGLTTAATIWLSGAVGVACAIEQYAMAASLTGIALFVLIALGALTRLVHADEDDGREAAEAPSRPSPAPDPRAGG